MALQNVKTLINNKLLSYFLKIYNIYDTFTIMILYYINITDFKNKLLKIDQ